MSQTRSQTRVVYDEYEDRRLANRPSAESLDYLRTVPTAFVSDCLKRLEIRNTTLRGVQLHHRMPDARVSFAGPAITMEFAPHRETMPYYNAPYKHTQIVEQAEAGDVIVIAGMGQPYGFWGEHTSHQALNQGVEAVVIDGYTRDIRAIRACGFPVFSTGITYESYVRRYDPVGYNVRCHVAGAQVNPGDVVMGDEDGVLVVPQEVVDRIAETAADIARLEVELEVAVKEGRPWNEIYRDIHHRKYYAS